MLAAVKTTKLFPSSITPNSRSGRRSSLLALRAPGCFSLTRWRNLYLFKPIIAVSEPEKKADSAVKVANKKRRNPVGRSVSDITV